MSSKALAKFETVEQVDGQVIEKTEPGIQAFTFGDVEGVLEGRQLFDYFASWHNGRWYEPPISWGGLAKSLHMSPHHESAINIKVNLLAKFYRPSRWLSRKEFKKLAKDYLVFGNAYPERIDNMAGRPMQIRRSPALQTRQGIKDGQFFFLPTGATLNVQEFKPDHVYQMENPDIAQEIYGIPEYLAALQSGWLNEAATLFRRKYYVNGSHAGYLMYISEEGFEESDREAMEAALAKSKGPGNFRNMLLHIPKGKKDGIQILPISEVMAKDDFMNIKNISRDDILAAHRVPPQLLGMVPVNAGGFGSAPQASAVFYDQEIEPLKLVFLELNDWIGLPVVAFDDYVPPPVVGSGSASSGANG